jgi:hypothetical protein
MDLRILAIAAAVLSSVVFAMPPSSQAMPRAAPVKIDAASNGNLVQVRHRRYCRYGRYHVRYHRHGNYREYQRSHYSNCPPYYGYYLPRYGSDRPCKSYYRTYYRSSKRPWFGF